jgi:hypothetical protein
MKSNPADHDNRGSNTGQIASSVHAHRTAGGHRHPGWHNFKGKSLVVMLFGDGHANGYRFPIKPEADPFWWVAPSPTNEWW